jgi:purine-binding chemotaxis protein CheW
MAKLKPLPACQAWVLGTLNLRGTPIPVVDLRQRIGGEMDPLAKTDLIVICRVAGGVCGMRVQDAVDVVARRVVPMGAGMASNHSAPFVAGVFVEGADQLVVVDVERAVGCTVGGLVENP